MDPEQTTAVESADSPTASTAQITAEDLIEEVSIDGMCGVY